MQTSRAFLRAFDSCADTKKRPDDPAACRGKGVGGYCAGARSSSGGVDTSTGCSSVTITRLVSSTVRSAACSPVGDTLDGTLVVGSVIVGAGAVSLVSVLFTATSATTAA